MSQYEQAITDKKYWNNVYSEINPRSVPESDRVHQLIMKYFSDKKGLSCFEVGCYPGPFMEIFGKLGYQLNGIDFCDKVHQLRPFFESKNFTVGKLWQQDFLDFNEPDTFDVVYSIGFIEHFENWDEILRKHCQIISNDGYLFIETPNFIGSFQNWFHNRYDKINLKDHYIPAMNVSKWAEIVKNEGFEIILQQYHGPFDFYTVDKQKGIKVIDFKILKNIIRPVLKKFLPRNVKSYSPSCVLIAQKSKN